MHLVSKQKVQRGRQEGSFCEIEGKEKVPSQTKSKRKTVESPAKGAPNKKLLASIMHAAKSVEV